MTTGRLSLTDIYWYQSTSKFINSHLFMNSQKGGLTIDLMIKPPLWECINKLVRKLYLKLHLKKITSKI